MLTRDGILFILWVVSAFADYIFFTFLWQMREYRFDRFRAFLHTRQGYELTRGYRFFWRPIIVLALYILLDGHVHLHWLVISVFSIDLLYNLLQIFFKRFRRPVFTLKALSIIFVSVTLEAWLAYVWHESHAVFFLFAFRFFLVTLVVFFFFAPTTLFKRFIVLHAKKKIERFPNLVVIGITGSHGKSSTKGFLAHVLSAKYRVIKTPKNINTEIGIAKFILQTDFSGMEVFVVEMGAYSMGEITYICKMVKPKIGILTTINEEHLALFKTIENTQKTKYELLRALPKNGLAVTNADNPYTIEFVHELSVPVETFGFDDENNPTALITGFKKRENGIRFTLEVGGTVYEFSTDIIGEHNAMNIAPTVLVGRHLGMSILDIQKQVETLVPDHGVIQAYKYGKATILDDTYNSNPAGFRAALDILGSYSSDQKRIVITRGMIELGDRAEMLHEEIGGEISFVADQLILISHNFEQAIKRGMVRDKYRTEILLKEDPKELLAYIKQLYDWSVVILLENKLPSIVYAEIQKKKQ